MRSPLSLALATPAKAIEFPKAAVRNKYETYLVRSQLVISTTYRGSSQSTFHPSL